MGALQFAAPGLRSQENTSQTFIESLPMMESQTSRSKSSTSPGSTPRRWLNVSNLDGRWPSTSDWSPRCSLRGSTSLQERSVERRKPYLQPHTHKIPHCHPHPEPTTK